MSGEFLTDEEIAYAKKVRDEANPPAVPAPGLSEEEMREVMHFAVPIAAINESEWEYLTVWAKFARASVWLARERDEARAAHDATEMRAIRAEVALDAERARAEQAERDALHLREELTTGVQQMFDRLAKQARADSERLSRHLDDRLSSKHDAAIHTKGYLAGLERGRREGAEDATAKRPAAASPTPTPADNA